MGALAAAACALAAVLIVSLRGCPGSGLILRATLVVVAAVFVALVAFVHPSGDDYPFAVALRDDDLWSAWLGYYRSWSGRFTALIATMLVTAMHPLTWACRAAILTVMAAQALALATIVWRALPDGISRMQAAWIACGFLCLCSAAMPSTSEGLYWPTGVLCYQLGTMSALAMVAMLLAPASARWATAGAGCAAFLAAGCNESSLVMTGVIVGAWILHRRAFERRWDRRGAAVALCFVIGAAIALLAPGNIGRLSHVGHHPNLWPGVSSAVAVAIGAIAGWLVLPVVGIATALVIISRWSQPPTTARLRVLVPAWLLGTVGACAPACIATGIAPPPRVIDVVFTWFVLGLLICAAVAAPRGRAWWTSIDAMSRPRVRVVIGIGSAVLVWMWFASNRGAAGDELLIMGLAALALLVVVIARFRRGGEAVRHRMRSAALVARVALALALVTTGNWPGAVRDLVIDAPLRSRELDRREAWLAGPAAGSRGLVRVPLPDPLHRPATIAYLDITADPQGWINRAYARYYGLDAIAVDPRVVPPWNAAPPVR